MKTKDIARQYNIRLGPFEQWIRSSGERFRVSVLGTMELDDSVDIASVVSRFRTDHAEEQRVAKEAEEARKAEEVVKREAVASMLITSGFNFDGFTITKYSGYISGDDAIQIDRGRGGIFVQATNVGESLLNALVKIRRNALAELKEAAYDLGCNAVIGVDFDYLVLDPETANTGGGTLYLPYVFAVTANGNAVIIERNIKQHASIDVEGESVLSPLAAVTELEVQVEPQLEGSWQPDPAGEHRLRWWDGVQWTEFTQD